MTASASSMARRLAGTSALSALALTAGGCTTAFNQREQIGFPNTTAGTMAIDGLANEAAWNQSSKIFLEDGSAVTAAFIRGMSDNNNLYLYFEVQDGANDTDAVILAFNPTGAANDYRRLDIYPCQIVGGGICSGTSASAINSQVEYSTGSLTGNTMNWTWQGAGQPPAGMEIRTAVAPSGNAGRWGVEVKIPRAAYNIPATGFFGLFANVIATSDPITDTAVQYSWPVGTIVGSNPNQASIIIQNAQLQVPRWGTATLDTSTFPTGLEITGFNNVGTDPSRISWSNNPPNEFTATVANNPQGTGGADALNVTAAFRIANWGITGFNPIPATPVPNSGQTIHANEYFPFSSGVWTLNGAEQTYWGTMGNQHACIEVQINHASGSFKRQFNMIFVHTNSPYRVEPRIATGAWRRKYKNAREVILNEHFYNAEPGLSWQSQFVGAEPAGEHRWQIRSMREQNRKLQATVAPDARLTLPADRYTLDARVLSAGGSLSIGVKPGSVLTLLADGEAKAGGRTVTAAGLNEAVARQGDEAAARQVATMPAERNRDVTIGHFGGYSKDGDVLRGGTPFRPGALIASFDNFRTSFAIGTGTTLYVPRSARTLALRLAGNLAFDEGQFELHAIPSEPNSISLGGLPISWFERTDRPVLLPLGANLPMHIVRGTLDTNRYITIKGRRFRALMPIGSYGEMIRSVRGSPAVFGRPVAARTAPAPVPAGPAGTE